MEANQLISGVYVKALHERRKDMRVDMCTCITHTHMHAHTRFVFYALLSCDLRVSWFTCYYRVISDLWLARSRRDMVCLMSSLFLSCVFLLVNSITPRLLRQPWLVARREVPGGGSWNFGRSNLRRTRSFNIYRRRLVYGSSRMVHSTLWKLTHFLRRCFSALPSLRPPCSGSRESGVSEPTLVI
jgi:hypothetical protein